MHLGLKSFLQFSNFLFTLSLKTILFFRISFFTSTTNAHFLLKMITNPMLRPDLTPLSIMFRKFDILHMEAAWHDAISRQFQDWFKLEQVYCFTKSVFFLFSHEHLDSHIAEIEIFYISIIIVLLSIIMIHAYCISLKECCFFDH